LKLFIDNSFETQRAATLWGKITTSWEKSSLKTCNSIEHAEIILITLTDLKGDYFKTIDLIAQSKKYAALADKVFVFDQFDMAIGLFPGIYASLRSDLFRRSRHRTGCYIQSLNEFITFKESDCDIRYLFSFQGNATSRVRNRLFSADFNRNDVLIEYKQPRGGRIGGGREEDDNLPQVIEFKRRYAEIIACSKFVLCPRGYGASSIRLFETMQSGRVPVIISDAWVPFYNIEWSKFSLRVREKDIAKLPEICLDAADQWVTMALGARRAWEEWFSHKGLAKLIETSLLDIKQTRKWPERLVRSLDWPLRRSLTQGRDLAVRLRSALRKKLYPSVPMSNFQARVRNSPTLPQEKKQVN
jgi:hypothetical protein